MLLGNEVEIIADKLKIDDLSNVNVNSAVLQDVFGVGDRMIRYLVEEGILERVGRGKYPLLKSVKSYITTLKVAGTGKVQNDDEYNLDEEKAKHEHVKRQITEIKLQLIKGQVHKAEDVEAVMTDMFAKFKSKIEGLPSKLAVQLEGEDKLSIQNILREELAAALEELSEYNPSDFYSDEHIEISDDAVNEVISNVSSVQDS